MTYEYLNQRIDEIDLKYPVELPTKALLLCLIAVTGIISIVGVMAFCKWWKGRKNHKQIKEIIKLFSTKEIVRQLAKQNMIKKQTESLEELPRLVATVRGLLVAVDLRVTRVRLSLTYASLDLWYLGSS